MQWTSCSFAAQLDKSDEEIRVIDIVLAYPDIVSQIMGRVLKETLTNGVDNWGWGKTAWTFCVMVLQCLSEDVTSTAQSGSNVFIHCFCTFNLLDQPH